MDYGFVFYVFTLFVIIFCPATSPLCMARFVSHNLALATMKS